MLAARSGLATGGKLASALTVMLSVAFVFACAIGTAAAGSSSSSSDASDPFYEFMRPRLGYFSRYEQSSPYARIYESYFENVIKNNDRAMESISTDDWRKVRPTGELCVDFLMGLTVKSYVMRKPYEVIILDACLDWIFNEEDEPRKQEKRADKERLDSSRVTALMMLEKDQKLRQVYESTQFAGAKLPEKLQADVHAYLMRLLQVYNANPRNGCHSQWLEAYNDFIDDIYVGDCEDESAGCQFYGLEGSERDSYLTMIAESTKEASKTCYAVMQTQMRGLMETEFEHSNSGPTTLAKRLLKTQVSRQLEREKWAREMVSILQLASGIDQETPVNLGEVVNALDRIKTGDEETIKRFTAALSQYAMANVDLKDSANDPSGRGRFGKAMGKLCRPYTDLKKFLSATGGINTDDDADARKPFEFYTLIYSLVRITNHEAIFGVTKDQFEDDVVKNRWEALYLATFACQIISTTWGELNYETNRGEFQVMLRPDSSIMIADWPIEQLQLKLPLIYPKSGSAGKQHKQHKEPKQPKAMFGKKFKLNFLGGGGGGNKHKEEEHQAPTTTPAPAPLSGLSALLEQPNQPGVLHQQQQQQQHQAAAATTGGAQAHAKPLMEPAKDSARDAPIMSLDTILMYKKLHGRYPKLPDYYKKIYPQLPDDLSGEYPKEAGLATAAAATTTPRPAPVAAPMAAFVMPQKKSTKPDYGSLANLKF